MSLFFFVRFWKKASLLFFFLGAVRITAETLSHPNASEVPHAKPLQYCFQSAFISTPCPLSVLFMGYLLNKLQKLDVSWMSG